MTWRPVWAWWAVRGATVLALLVAGGGWIEPLRGQEATVRRWVVVDATTGEPLSGVRVEAGRLVVESGRDGAFVLPEVAGGVEVTVERLGYEGVRARVSELGPEVRLVPRAVLLDEVAVAAARWDGLAAGTALAVGGVGGEVVRAGSSTTVAEGLEGMEGVAVSRMGSWGARPVLRGLGGDRVVVMLNGMRLTRACAFGMDQGLATVDPGSVERVEVLSGPGSTLYGSGNVGGVVNVVTRRARRGAPVSGELRASGSTGVPGGSVGATVEGRWGGVEVLASVDGSGYGDYRTPTGRVEDSGYRQASGEVGVGYTWAGGERLSAQGQFYEGRDIGWPATAGASIPRESRRGASLDYGAQLGGGIVDAVAVRGHVQRLDHEMVVGMRMVRPDGSAVVTTTEQRSHSTVSGGRVQLRLRPVAGSHADVGVEATHWGAEATRWQERRVPGAPPAELVLRSWPAVRIVDVGAFGQGEARLSEGVVASAGARLDRVGRRAEGWQSSAEWVFTGNAGVRARLAGAVVARAVVGWGYRIPDATELFGLALKADGFAYQGNPELATERNRNVEVGVGREGEHVEASLTLFRNDLAGMIAPVLLPGDTMIGGRPVRSYENVAAARLEGVSASARWRAAGWLELSGSATYVEGEDRVAGGPLAQVPPLSGRLAARVVAGGSSSRWLELAWRGAARQTRVAAAIGEPETPGYGLVDVRAGMSLGGVEVRVGVDNLLDHDYRAHLDPAALLRPGRSLHVGLVRTFGRAGGG